MEYRDTGSSRIVARIIDARAAADGERVIEDLRRIQVARRESVTYT